MKKIMSIFLLFVFLSSLSFAQSETEYSEYAEMTLSGNGQVLAIVGRTLLDTSISNYDIYPIDIFDTQTGETVKIIKNILPGVEYAGDDNFLPRGIGLNYNGTLLSYYTRFGNADVVDIQTEERVMALQTGGAVEAGSTNWSRGNNSLVAIFGISASQVFDVNLQKKIVTNIYPLDEINYSIAISISNDGTLLAESMGTETTAYLSIWDIPATYEFAPPKLFLENIGSRSISWKSDNTQVVSNARGHVDIADVNTGNVTKLYLANPDEVIQAVSWSPDGTKIAGGSRNNIVWIWDVTTGQIIGNYPTEFSVTSVAWSPDSRRLYHTGGSEGVYINGLPMAEAIALENVPTLTPTTSP